MNTVFIITGGAGRVINSIPALEKYERQNPNDNFKIIVHGWEQLFWSHPMLQKRTFGFHQKDLFNQILKQSNVVYPEPYYLHSFFNQQCNLIEAFDECINKTQDHNDLNYNCLYLSKVESNKIKELTKNFKDTNKKRKLIVFQPYGSSVESINNEPIDETNRSLSLYHYFEIVKALKNDAAIVYTSQPQFRHPNDKYSIAIDEYKPYLRTMMGLISECDYFVGVCSVGQHMARAFNKPGLVLMGATMEQNFSYPEHFTIYRKKDRVPEYSPWRLFDTDCEFSNRQNDGIMDFTNDELKEIIKIIKTNIADTNSINFDEKHLEANYE
jgi:hypothetical protein